MNMDDEARRARILESLRDEVGIAVEALGNDRAAVLRECVRAIWPNASIHDIVYFDGGEQYTITPPNSTWAKDRLMCGHERYGSTDGCAEMACWNYVNKQRASTPGCGCVCTSGGFCGGCGHAGCGRC